MRFINIHSGELEFFFHQDKNWSMREYLGKGKKIDVACFAENNSKACFNHRTKLQCVFINYN